MEQSQAELIPHGGWLFDGPQRLAHERPGRFMAFHHQRLAGRWPRQVRRGPLGSSVLYSLLLIDVCLDIPAGDELKWNIQDHVGRVGCLKHQEARFVRCSRLTIIDQRKHHGVAIHPVVSAGARAVNRVDRSRRRIRDSIQAASRRSEGLHVELVAVPIDLEVIGGPMQIAVDFRALGHCDTCHRHLLSTAGKATRSGSTVRGDGTVTVFVSPEGKPSSQVAAATASTSTLLVPSGAGLDPLN